MKKIFVFLLVLVMMIFGVFNFFITMTNFGPEVALACNDLCIYVEGPCGPGQGDGWHCLISPYDYGWGCIGCPWNTC